VFERIKSQEFFGKYFIFFWATTPTPQKSAKKFIKNFLLFSANRIGFYDITPFIFPFYDSLS